MTKILKTSALALQTVVNKLKEGGIVCFPTETVYALSCDPYNDQVVAKIYQLKQRHVGQPLSILVKNLEQIKQIAYTDIKTEEIINRLSPGPVTYILRRRNISGLSHLINSEADTIGVRIPDHDISQNILGLFAKPIIGTSVNFSGEKGASNVDEIDSVLLSSIDVVINGGQSQYGVSSTVIDLSDSGEMKILRNGVIKLTK